MRSMNRLARVGRMAAVVAVAAVGAAAAGSPPISEARVQWTELRFVARKLIFGASTTVSWQQVDATGATADLPPLPPDLGPAPSGARLVAVTLSSDLPFGRDEKVTAWIDPATGAAVATEKLGTGSKPVRKVQRFGASGLAWWRWEPEKGQQGLPPDRWGHFGADTVRWAACPEAPPITDSYALLWLLSAMPRDTAGRVVEARVVTRGRLVSVDFTAGGLTQIHANFELVAADGSRSRRREPVTVREVRVGARAADEDESAEDVDLGFLGMRGSLTAYLDLDTGVPVELRGRAGGIGNVRVRLDRAVLAAQNAH
jgi:hypothetical protein